MAINGNFYQVRVLAVLAPQIALNVFHYDVTATTGTGATEAQIALAFDNLLAAAYKAVMANPATYRGVGTKKVYPTQGLESISIANVGVGTGGANTLPFQTAALLHIQTALAGRKGRGRAYLPFPPVAGATAGGEMAAGYVALCDAVGTALKTGVTAGGGGNTNTFTLGVYHRQTSAMDLWTSVACMAKWATQRRRGDYGRPNVAPF